jgi:hypothetical protein
MSNRNAPAHKGEGVVCELPGYTDAHSTTTARFQYPGSISKPVNTCEINTCEMLLIGCPIIRTHLGHPLLLQDGGGQ